MTTEDDFQAALDAIPEDWQTRLVFADWLQENDDPRAEGYRALGAIQKWPLPCARGLIYYYVSARYLDTQVECSHFYQNGLPSDWLGEIDTPYKSTGWESPPGDRARIEWRHAPSPFEVSIFNAAPQLNRREAEDAAALAFAKLPAARRAELLTSPTPA